MRPARALRAAAAVALLFGATPALANDAAAAREQLKKGYDLAQAGQCAEAIPHLTESLKLDVKAITLINLADCEEKVGRLADALGHWVDARARAQVEGNGPIQTEAERRAKALEPRLPRLTVKTADGTPGDAVVVRDGIELGSVSLGVPLPVNPGKHALVVRAPGRADATFEVELAEGEQKELEVGVGPALPPQVANGPAALVEPPREPEDRGTSPLVWVGFGVAAAGAATGAVTGLMALGKASTVKQDCPNNECASQAALDDVSSGRTLGTVSTVAFAVGGAGALLGIYGLVWGSPAKEKSVAFTVTPGGGVVRGTF